jgi:hypothetical protein
MTPRHSSLPLSVPLGVVTAFGVVTCAAAQTPPFMRQLNALDDSLSEAAFGSPPIEARPSVYWVWLNGYTDREQLTRDLEAMKAMGLRGADIVDMGAINSPRYSYRLYPMAEEDDVVPVGPPFMGPESVQAIAHAIREAGRLGLELGLITSSSYNAGGPWITPELANMGLYCAVVAVEGPGTFDDTLPFPALPDGVYRGADGLPQHYEDVAVLAMPADLVPGYGFIFQPAGDRPVTIDRVVLYNTHTDSARQYGGDLYVKEFSVSVSTETTASADFREILRGTLEPRTGPQAFGIDPVAPKYVKLYLHSGHNPEQERLELGEFEAYSADGTNVLDKRIGGKLLHFTSEDAPEAGSWNAGNINDGAHADPHGSWRSGPMVRRLGDPANVLDLTDRLKGGGQLRWDIPAGRWTIARFVSTNTGQHLIVPSPKSDGLMLDHYNPAATDFHIRYIADRLLEALGRDSFEGTALKYLYMCSYEPHGTIPWSDDFLEALATRFGYDPTPYLPFLKGWRPAGPDSTALAARFHRDYNRFVADRLASAHYATGRRVSNEYGLGLCAEAGGPGGPVEALQASGELDLMRGEFWIGDGAFVMKGIASAAHGYGHRIAEMEAFTTGHHWTDGPFEYKPWADRAICEGSNRFVIHTFGHEPPEAGLPGWGYYAGVHFEPTNTWWSTARPLVDYLARISYIAQRGWPVADVCYYQGGDAPNKIPPKHLHPALGFGYDYDVTNPTVLLTRMGVRDRRLVLPDGMTYEVLILPDREDMDLEVLEKLAKLVRDGATVIGRRPTRSPGLTDYEARTARIRRVADRLWGKCDGKTVTEHAHGRGKLVWGRTVREVLAERGIGPDFDFVGSRPDESSVDFMHRRTSDADLYFISNKRPEAVELACSFRVAGRQPELWDADSGRVFAVRQYRVEGGRSHLTLRLDPHGSAIVVFRNRAADAQPLPTVERPTVVDTRNVGGDWTVRFPPGWGAPSERVFPELVSWTDDPDHGIKYFSGTATYEKTIEIPAEWLAHNRHIYLDLGQVRATAAVRVNERTLGVLWKPPFVLDLTEAIRPGRNRLAVEVTNVWKNRLIGDAELPPDRRFCRTNLRTKVSRGELQPSGLLGPVELRLMR